MPSRTLGHGQELHGAGCWSCGRGIWETALGVLMVQTYNGLDILVVSAYWQDVIRGMLIVAEPELFEPLDPPIPRRGKRAVTLHCGPRSAPSPPRAR
jgi:hypothetical protein